MNFFFLSEGGGGGGGGGYKLSLASPITEKAGSFTTCSSQLHLWITTLWSRFSSCMTHDLTSNGIDLVKEDDTSFLCSCHFKQLPHHPSTLQTIDYIIITS